MGVQLQFRQGDVFLGRVDKLPHDAQKQNSGAQIILAYGEVTGHAHRVSSSNATLYGSGDQRYLVVVGPNAELVHEEHAPISLLAGVYKIVQQREYIPGQPPGWVSD